MAPMHARMQAHLPPPVPELARQRCPESRDPRRPLLTASAELCLSDTFELDPGIAAASSSPPACRLASYSMRSSALAAVRSAVQSAVQSVRRVRLAVACSVRSKLTATNSYQMR